MRTKIMHVATFAALGAALAATLTGCHSSDSALPPSTGGGASNVVVTGSSPAGGDGTITDLGSVIINNAGTGTDELNLSETGHDLTIVWDTNTHVINSVQHGWGAGLAQCGGGGAHNCVSANVTLDFAAHTLTFTNLALPDDPFGGTSTCTLNGTAVW